MCLIFDENQLGSNSNLAQLAANASFKHVLDAELAPDAAHPDLFALVLHDRGTGDDTKMLGVEVAHMADHLFGESVAEIILRGISRKVFKRKHCQHVLARRRIRSTVRA